MSTHTSVPPTFPVAILGPTGYTGLELLELLARHPSLRVAYLATAREKQPRIDVEFPRLAGRLGPGPGGLGGGGGQQGGDVDPQCRPIDHDAIAGGAKLAFLCLPHEAAMHHAPALLARGVKVVDLSAAYRLKDPVVYEQAYGHKHTDPANLEHAVYGLCEAAREQVKGARLVANPGCYPTAAALSLLPLLRAGVIDPGEAGGGIIINAASGVSGAGREPKPNTTLAEAGDNYSPYGIGTHRHQPEINQTLHLHAGGRRAGGGALFVPHLLPIERGILETIYARPASSHVDTERVMSVLRHAYAGEPFVKVRDEAPALRHVNRTNQVHINARVVGGWVVVVAAIDNLVKGASGQAIQNANLMLGLNEAAGLN